MLRGRGITGTSDYPTTFVGIFRRVLAEEGPRALYRGYMAYMLAIVFWMSALPAGTDFVMNVGPYLTDQIQNRGKLRQAQLDRQQKKFEEEDIDEFDDDDDDFDDEDDEEEYD